MNKFNAIALAHTIATVDLVLHPLFHLWVYLAPQTYVQVMNMFVAGLQLQISSIDTSLTHVLLGTIAEATALWILGYGFASLYNRLAK